MKSKRPLWQLLGVISLLTGIWLAMFQPTLADDTDIRDFAWPAILLRFCLYAPLCFAIFGLLLYPLKIARWLFSWRVLKGVLRALAVFLLFVALFYLEEDWRGKRDWDNYRRHWEAQGEKFDFASFIPPPVADDQNFALTPIVASCYSRYLDKTGNRLNPENTNVVNRLAMGIYRSDVLGNTNATFGDWRQSQRVSLSAWQQYYRAPTDTNFYESSGTNDFPTVPNPQSPAADVLLALGKFATPLEDLRQAAFQCPESRFPLNYHNTTPIQLILPHLPTFENCRQVLELRAIAEVAEHQNENALADVQLILYLANSIQKEPDYNSQRIRLNLIFTTIQPIWEGMAEHKWSDEQLIELDQALGKFHLLADYPFAMRSDRATGLTTVEFMRNNRLRALNCIQIINNLSAYSDYWQPNDLDEPLPLISQLISLLIPDGWFYANETTIGRMYELFLPASGDKNNQLAFIKLKQAKGLLSQSIQHPSPHNAIALMIGPPMSDFADKFIQVQTSLDLARVACALERYRLAHGVYPEKIDELAPPFIAAIPLDIINGQPLHYHRTENGNFVLYSVGWNEKDDGGTPGLSEGGYNDYHKGDWVWQYQKP